MTTTKILSTWMILSLATTGAIALAGPNVVFDGYYRIETKSRHVGFAILRREIDPTTKNQTIKYFLQTTDTDRVNHRVVITEKVDSNLKPLEYEIVQSGDTKPAKMHVTFGPGASYGITSQTHDTKADSKTGAVPKGAFMSAELGQILMALKPKPGQVYNYSAMKETFGKIMDGQIKILDRTRIGQRTLTRTFDDFYVPPEESWYLDDGQLIASAAPDRGVTVVLVANPDRALEGIEFNRSDLIPLFGEIPTGSKNAIAAKEITFDSTLFKTAVDTKFKRVSNAIPLGLKP